MTPLPLITEISPQGHGYCQINQQIRNIQSKPLCSSLKNKQKFILGVKVSKAFWTLLYLDLPFPACLYQGFSQPLFVRMYRNSAYQFLRSKANLLLKTQEQCHLSSGISRTLQSGNHTLCPIPPILSTCSSPKALATVLHILLFTYVQILPLWQARDNTGSGRHLLVSNTESIHAMKSCLRDEWKNN